MRIRISYSCEFAYEAPVSFSPHIFRLLPKSDRFVSVLNTSFQTNSGADVQYRRDLFDNEVIRCFYPKHSTTLEARLELELLLQQKNAFHFLLEPHAWEFPFRYLPEEMEVLAPYLTSSGLELPFWQAESGPTVDRLTELNTAIYQNLAYERREEGPARAPEETLAHGAGACRDFAVLLAQSLRTRGIAARLASGYLCELGRDDRRAEGALHAWTEAYLPGAGWLGLDPTNGILCNENHLTTAVGLRFEHIAPVSGTYYGHGPIGSSLNSNLQILACE